LQITHDVGREKLKVSGESLVEPDVTPPLWRNQVTEPLVRQFVGDDRQDSLLVGSGGEKLVVQQIHFPDN